MSTRYSLSFNFGAVELSPEAQQRIPPERRDATCPAYHLYKEALSIENDVYLELTGKNIEFEATPDSIIVRIPQKVWNRIIKIGEITD